MKKIPQTWLIAIWSNSLRSVEWTSRAKSLYTQRLQTRVPLGGWEWREGCVKAMPSCTGPVEGTLHDKALHCRETAAWCLLTQDVCWQHWELSLPVNSWRGQQFWTPIHLAVHSLCYSPESKCWPQWTTGQAQIYIHMDLLGLFLTSFLPPGPSESHISLGMSRHNILSVLSFC